MRNSTPNLGPCSKLEKGGVEDFKYFYLAHKGRQSGVKDLHVGWCGVDTVLTFCGEVRSEEK